MAGNVRQNYAEECEVAINKQINMELYASYVYLSMSAYFDRDDVALPGFAKFFKKSAQEERHHADIMIKFQNDRGGRVILNDVKYAGTGQAVNPPPATTPAAPAGPPTSGPNATDQSTPFQGEEDQQDSWFGHQGPAEKPEKDSWGSGLEAMEAALALERTVNQCLLDIHKISSAKDDPHMCDWLEDNFLREQVESIRELAGYVTNLRRVGPGLGEYLFDQETLKGEGE